MYSFSEDENQNIENLVSIAFANKYGTKYKARYGELFNNMYDLITESKFYNSKTICLYDGDKPFVSTITMSLISGLQAVQLNINDRKQFIRNYVRELAELFVSDKYYKENDYSPTFCSINSIFTKTISREDVKDETFDSLPQITREILANETNDYYQLQKSIWNIFNSRVSWSKSYHSDYINFLTFGTFIFINTIKKIDGIDKDQVLKSYLENFYNINIYEKCLYEEYDCRDWFSY